MLEKQGVMEAATGFEPEPNSAKTVETPSKTPELAENREKNRPPFCPLGPPFAVEPLTNSDAITAIGADARAKWDEGRARYGEAWGGDPRGPIAELYFEALDSLNYIEEAERRGEIKRRQAQRWRRSVLVMAVEVRARLVGQ